jgi:tryptophan-rich sensory protein
MVWTILAVLHFIAAGLALIAKHDATPALQLAMLFYIAAKVDK